MGKKSLKQQIHECLSQGMSKAEAFAKFQGAGAKDSRLAQIIAAYPDPLLCQAHRVKRRLVIALASLQLILALGSGLVLGARHGAVLQLCIAGGIALIPALLLWAFMRNLVGAYNAYIYLSLMQLPSLLGGWGAHPGQTVAAVVLNLGFVLFVRNVRESLFPYATLFGTRKRDGRYAFLTEVDPSLRNASS